MTSSRRTSLPAELLSLTLDFVAQDDTCHTQLRQCSLVSRTFCSLTQSILFRSIALDDNWPEEEEDDNFEQDIQVLYRLFTHSPHLCKYVRQLSFGFRSMNTPELCCVLRMLPNVSSLIADGYDEAFKVWFARGMHFRNSMAMIQEQILPKLHHFKLSFFWDLLDFDLHRCRQARTLEVIETDLSTSLLSEHPSSEVHPLRRLIYGLPTVSFVGCEIPLVNFIQTANCQPSFLRISSPNHYRDEHEVISACNVMNACASSVTHLEITDFIFDDVSSSTWYEHFSLSNFPPLQHLVLHLGEPLCNTNKASQLSRLITLIAGGGGDLRIERISVCLTIPSDWDAPSEAVWKGLDHAIRKDRMPSLQSFCFVVKEIRGRKPPSSHEETPSWIETALSHTSSRGLVSFSRLPQAPRWS